MSIGVQNPIADLDVGGYTHIAKNAGIDNLLYIGSSSTDFASIGYLPATTGKPGVITITPKGSSNYGPSKDFSSGTPASEQDPTDLLCLGTSVPPSLVYMQNQLILQHKYQGTSGGNMRLGHNGTNGVLETGGSGITNRALVIHKECGRNVYVFGGENFAPTTLGVLSIDGKLNVAQNIQLSSTSATSFLDNSSRLYIDGSAATGIKIRQTNTTGQAGIKIVEENGDDHALSVNLTTNTTDGIEAFHINGNGNTKIGTDIHSIVDAKLTISQASPSDRAIAVYDNSNSSALKNRLNVYGDGKLELIAGNSSRAFSIKNASDSDRETFYIKDNGYLEMRVYSPLNMPVPPGALEARVMTIRDVSANNGNGKDLFVIRHDGRVYARSIEVSLDTDFPDYVFEQGYRLKPLEEIERYIQQYQRLPGFETAEFYKLNGINVSEIILKQQEKIEELTMYVIRLNQQLKELQKHQ